MYAAKRILFAVVFVIVAVPVFAADLVTVTTSVSNPQAYQGGADEGTVLIENHTTADVRARLNMKVVFADGTVQKLTGITDPGVIPPGGGFFLSVYFVIPPDAALGTAQFVAEVSATSGGLSEQETSSQNFDVLPAQ